jgi:hypothetical protein
MIEERAPGSQPKSCGRCCLLLVAGGILGLLAQFGASTFISNTWSYCMNMAWPEAYDFADSPRFYLLVELPLFAAYCCAFPLGFLLARRFLRRSRRRFVRALVGSLAGLLLLSVVFTGDVVYNLAPPHGMYLSARCPSDRPPWWPKPLPLRVSAADHPRPAAGPGGRLRPAAGHLNMPLKIGWTTPATIRSDTSIEAWIMTRRDDK